MDENEEIERWRRAAFELWAILDGIDSLDDICREDDKAFRTQAYERQRGRFKHMSGEDFDAIIPLYRPAWDIGKSQPNPEITP